jgi:hypothetical protein
MRFLVVLPIHLLAGDVATGPQLPSVEVEAQTPGKATNASVRIERMVVPPRDLPLPRSIRSRRTDERAEETITPNLSSHRSGHVAALR